MDNPDWMGFQTCIGKKQGRNSLGSIVCYPKETDVEGYDQIREQNQDSWSAIYVDLTQRLMGVVGDILLDFRSMLSTTCEELEASHLQYTLGGIAISILLQCPHLTHLSVKIGTT